MLTLNKLPSHDADMGACKVPEYGQTQYIKPLIITYM